MAAPSAPEIYTTLTDATPTATGGISAKKATTWSHCSLRRSTGLPLLSAAWTWNQFFAMSSPTRAIWLC